MLLLNAVPIDKRGAVAEAGGLDALVVPASAGNAQEQELVLEIIEAYGDRPSAYLLPKLAAFGASDKVRKRAGELIPKLGAS
jgi:hypothetical protein